MTTGNGRQTIAHNTGRKAAAFVCERFLSAFSGNFPVADRQSPKDQMAGSRTLLILFLLLAAAGSATAADAPRGATSCSGCHAVKAGIDTPLKSLKGRKAADIVETMTAFKSDRQPATVMNRIAKGFSDSEIAAIAAWWSEQQP
jgi:cytochrome c553